MMNPEVKSSSSSNNSFSSSKDSYFGGVAAIDLDKQKGLNRSRRKIQVDLSRLQTNTSVNQNSSKPYPRTVASVKRRP